MEQAVELIEPLGHTRVQRITRPVDLMTTARLIAHGFVAQLRAQLQQAAPALFHAGQRSIRAFRIHVREYLAGAAEAGESGVLHARPGRMGTPLQHQHTMPRELPLVVQGREQAHQPGTDHHQVLIPLKSLLFPNAQHPNVDRGRLPALDRGTKVVVIWQACEGFLPNARMSTVPASRFLRPFLFVFLLLGTLCASAQVDNVYVYGTVKDYVSSKKLDGITVTVFKNGAKLAEVVTSASGKYEFNLDYGSDFKLVYSKPGMVSKNISIDTKNIPEEERVGGHGMNVEMTLFQELPGIDFTILQQPIGKAKFDPTSKEVTWDLQYTDQVRSEIARLMKEYDDKKKREAGAAADYDKLMAQGDASMSAAEYGKAIEHFTGALAVKAGDAKATAKLSDAKMKQDELNASKKEAEQYAAFIKEADGLFAKKDYANAMTKYKAASDVKEQETYPKGKMKECQAFIDDLAKKAEEEKKARELEEKYKAAIASADASMKGEKYEDARTKYTEASGLKPEEKYPKDQLAAIAKKLEELAKKAEEDKKKKELDAQYQALITAADAAFKAANYDQAKNKYTEALGLKAEEKYPKDQLAAIDKKLDELAKQAEADRKKKELDDAYNAAIAKADGAFRGKKWDEAKAGYNEALGLKSGEKYPKDQLAAIDKAIADEAKLAEEARKKKELDDAYNAAIAAADASFQSKSWEPARTSYNEALKLKTGERYPKDQLAAIDKAIADAAREAEEAKKKKELDDKYNALVAAADGLFKDQKLENAKTKFQEAAGVKPAEAYPKEKIAQIDALLADAARKAEDERKQKELNDRYNALIAKADKSFDGEKFADALNDYKDALQLKPNEQHPKDRIADINGRMDAAAKAKAEADRLAREKADLEKRYTDLITAADRAFGAKDYAGAKSSYTDALSVRPGEKHPTDRIAQIDKILADLAAQAEADRLKAERDAAEKARLAEEERKRNESAAQIEARYRDAISKGDIAFSGEKFDEARERYTEALTIKAGEKYPKDQLEAIEKLLADRERAKLSAEEAERERLRLEEERRRKAEADAEAARLAGEDEKGRLAAEKAREAEYQRIIQQADQAMAGKDYSNARDLYTQSLDIKANETYPKAKIEQIDKLLEELERQRRAAELAAQQKTEPEPVDEGRTNSTIDIRKEQEAEQFMRDALAREEAEKYERIRKMKSDMSEMAVTEEDQAAGRREEARRNAYAPLESEGSIYSGSDDMRMRHLEELDSLRQAWAQRQQQIRELADQSRGGSMAANDEVREQIGQQATTQQERQAQRTADLQDLAAQRSQAIADEASANDQRREQARTEAQALADGRAAMQEKGAQIGQGLLDQVSQSKEQMASRHQDLANRSEDSRLAAKEAMEHTPVSQQRSFSDYNRGQLANTYPQGVTEESYTEGNKVIIRRVVVQGNKADNYTKVIGKVNTCYFKNGQVITEWIWSRDTE